jgi:hypothetical protein
MWSMSRLVQLGTGRADSEGLNGQLLPLPGDIEPGPHTLVVQGVDASGTPITLQVGFTVIDPQLASSVSSTDSNQWWWLLLLIPTMIVIGWVIIAARRRRKEEEDESGLGQVGTAI